MDEEKHSGRQASFSMGTPAKRVSRENSVAAGSKAKAESGRDFDECRPRQSRAAAFSRGGRHGFADATEEEDESGAGFADEEEERAVGDEGARAR